MSGGGLSRPPHAALALALTAWGAQAPQAQDTEMPMLFEQGSCDSSGRLNDFHSRAPLRRQFGPLLRIVGVFYNFGLICSDKPPTYGEKLRRNGATIKGSFHLYGSPTRLPRLPRHGAPWTSNTKAIAATWDRAPPAPATWRHRVEDRRRGQRWQTERRRSAV